MTGTHQSRQHGKCVQDRSRRERFEGRRVAHPAPLVQP